MAEITAERLDQLVSRERALCEDITGWLRSGAMAKKIPPDNATWLIGLAEDNRDALISLLSELAGIIRSPEDPALQNGEPQ